MRYLVKVAYDGLNYAGWQKQPDKITIQATIEKALRKFYHQPIKIVVSGRTDAAVHALGQTFHFDVTVAYPPANIKKGLNSSLPVDIQIIELDLVSPDFHARYAAKFRTYLYLVNLGDYNLFERDYVYQLNQKINLRLLKKALTIFVGQHDFTSFNVTPLKDNYNQVRTITKFTVVVKDDHLQFEITGDGFLRYMVRMLVAVCLQVALGKLTLVEVEIMLQQRQKGVNRFKAPAMGLYLKNVQY